MKTEITMNKADLIRMIKESIGKVQLDKIKITNISASVILDDNTKQDDFKHIIFTLETE